MHVSTKETDDNGVHILTNTLEADGPLEMASADAKISASVIAVRRTDSGGVFVQTAVTISEPVPVAAPAPPSRDDVALAYLEAKGKSAEDAKAMLGKFGTDKILGFKAKDEEAKQAELDAELAKALE